MFIHKAILIPLYPYISFQFILRSRTVKARQGGVIT